MSEEEFAAKHKDAYGQFSIIDSDNVSQDHFDRWKDLDYHDVQLESGDCFYLPARWTHTAKAPQRDRSISFNLWVRRVHRRLRETEKEGQPYTDKYCGVYVVTK